MPDRTTLEETIALLEATLEATHDGILVLDRDHRIVRYNHLLAEMLHLPLPPTDTDDAERLLGRVVAELEDPETFERRSKELRADLAATATDVLRFKDGRVFERFVAPNRIGGTIVGRVISLRDIGPALRAQESLEQHRAVLEDQLRQSQKMEAIGRLAGGIAHDLNNALTAIAGYAELALNEVAADHAARNDVEEIRRAAERAGSVTRQLLAFSRKQLLEPRVFDLNETIAAISRLLARLLGADVDVQTRLSGEMLPVLGDPGQVEQAVINLAVNARDAMPGGGTLVLATAREIVDEPFARSHPPLPAGPYVVLRVSDSGHGMPADTMAHIFEPFFTTKDVGKGTGLGLSMVYGTMKQSGGFIFVDSEIDRGTTFQLYFPPAAAPAAAADGAARGRTGERHGHETLLIAEDEPSVRNLVASALRHDGYHLLLAASAEEAIALAEAHDGPIDLLLTDATMPGKSGIELAQLMTQRRPGIPIIVMSGYTEEALDLPGLAEPIALLQKPFTPRELRRRLRDILDR